MDWQTFIFEPSSNMIEKMDKIALRSFHDEDAAGAAVNFALDKLKQDNWAELNKFEGKNGASASTYFCAVFTNAVIDYYRKVYGRCEPPSWVKQLGEFWSKLFKQLCCEQVEEHKLINTYKAEQPEDDVRQAIIAIKAKDPKCFTRGKKHHHVSLDQQDASEQVIELSSESIESKQSAESYEDVLHGLSLWLKNETSDHAAGKIVEELQTLAFDDETMILLRLIYQESYKLPDAAEFIGMKAYTARRRVNEAVEAISSLFKKQGVEFFDV